MLSHVGDGLKDMVTQGIIVDNSLEGLNVTEASPNDASTPPGGRKLTLSIDGENPIVLGEHLGWHEAKNAALRERGLSEKYSVFTYGWGLKEKA